jgi:hypothetical protein
VNKKREPPRLCVHQVSQHKGHWKERRKKKEGMNALVAREIFGALFLTWRDQFVTVYD